jgi:glycerol-3-phosphate dehydrogenase
MHDVAVVGAGVSGASVARTLAAYRLSVVLLERAADVASGVSKANSGIVHAGFHHPPGSLKARLELRGNLMFDTLQVELGFPFRRCGIIVAAFGPEEMQTVAELHAQGLANGVPRLEIVGRERLLALEPKLSRDVVGGLYAPTGGIVEPYRYGYALVEAAVANGVELATEWDLVEGHWTGDRWVLSARDGRRVEARRVVNAAGLYADEVSRSCGAEDYRIGLRKGEEFILERGAPGFPGHVIFPVPSEHTKGVLVIPTVEGTTMVGPTAEDVDDKEDTSTTPESLDRALQLAARLVPAVSRREIISAFAGIRPVLPGEDFMIEPSRRVPGFIHVAGIQSPGLTASPAIGEYVKDLLKQDGLELVEKVRTTPVSRPERMRDRTHHEIESLIARDPSWGHVVCRCENVSEAEVVEAIRKGHATLDGIKYYTRAGMGRCQGGFCTYRILRIVSRETGLPLERITKRGGASRLLVGRIGEGGAPCGG